jgi:hypothetical protein
MTQLYRGPRNRVVERLESAAKTILSSSLRSNLARGPGIRDRRQCEFGVESAALLSIVTSKNIASSEITQHDVSDRPAPACYVFTSDTIITSGR